MVVTPANSNGPPATSRVAASLALIVRGFGEVQPASLERETNIECRSGRPSKMLASVLRLIGIHLT